MEPRQRPRAEQRRASAPRSRHLEQRRRFSVRRPQRAGGQAGLRRTRGRGCGGTRPDGLRRAGGSAGRTRRRPVGERRPPPGGELVPVLRLRVAWSRAWGAAAHRAPDVLEDRLCHRSGSHGSALSCSRELCARRGRHELVGEALRRTGQDRDAVEDALRQRRCRSSRWKPMAIGEPRRVPVQE